MVIDNVSRIIDPLQDNNGMTATDNPEQRPLLPPDRRRKPSSEPAVSVMSGRAQWISLALASGACAACNGVFAKLTTTEMTSQLAGRAAEALGLGRDNVVVELGMRGLFFALNLIFNGVMWGLFTTALARAASTTHVTVINTSANFMLTALLGALIFAEQLPPRWWIGAAMLVAGNVIIGRGASDEEKKKQDDPLHHSTAVRPPSPDISLQDSTTEHMPLMGQEEDLLDNDDVDDDDVNKPILGQGQ